MTSASQLEDHRSALFGHCYRMLGSPFEAEDAVQETLVRAFKGLDRFDGRAQLRTWLYRIATNVCLDALADRKRRARLAEWRARPVDVSAAGTVHDELVARPHTDWLEPVPDALAVPQDADPAERAILRQSIRLAFVAALQHLPPKQRAAVLSTEVLGWSAVETAECLETSVASVNSALQRARSTLAKHANDDAAAESLSSEQRELLERYVEAFERYDMDAMTALMRDDVTLSMPPFELWLQGPEAIRAWLLGRGSECRGSRLVATAANGLPAFGQYRSGGPGRPHKPWSLTVLELSGSRITSWTAFLDTERLFPLFGLPPELDAETQAEPSAPSPR